MTTLVERSNVSTNGFKRTLIFNEYFAKFAAMLGIIGSWNTNESNLTNTDKDRSARFKNYLRILIKKLSENYL